MNWLRYVVMETAAHVMSVSMGELCAEYSSSGEVPVGKALY